MKAAGLESPDISILSDDFLAEIRETEKKNLAIEAPQIRGASPREPSPNPRLSELSPVA
jgi:Domain of unknown function (DUF3387)